MSSAWLIWFVLGVGAAFVELLLPGFIVLFFAIGCWVVAAVLLVFDLTLAQQILVFLISSVASLVLLRRWMMQTFRGPLSDKSNSDFDDFPAGVRVPVLERITPVTSGRIRYRGTAWDAAAEEIIEVGEIVEIVRYAGDSRRSYFVKKV